MTEAEITELVSTQRNYFKTGETLSVAYRIAALKKLNVRSRTGFKRTYLYDKAHQKICQ